MAQLWANHLVIDIRKGTLTMNKIVEAFLKGEKVREKRWNKGDFEQRKVFFKTTPYHPKL